MDHQHHRTTTTVIASDGGEPNQPVARTRWTPKPEQIMILESIFDGGLVNPPKEETKRIRKLLEPFGPVGDTNIFYWFQNRRSRSRRHQKQIIQAAAEEQLQETPPICCGGGIQCFGNTVFPGRFPEAPPLTDYNFNPSCPLCFAGSCSSSAPLPPYGAGEIHDGSASGENLFGLQQFDESSNFFSGDASDFHHQSGYSPEIISVYINGVATDVRRGVPVDVATMFHLDNFVLVNAHGFLVQSFDQHGENYFLVPRES